MWTKTRKALESRLADCLKKRVSYNFAVYSTNKYKYYMEMYVFYIQVDKKVWFASNPNEYNKTQKNIMDIVGTPKREDYWEVRKRAEEPARNKTIYETGMLDVDEIMEDIHQYLNCFNIEECLKGENYFLYMLAILDRRVGKRRIKVLYENVEDEPEWIQKFIRLRAEAEKFIR